MCYNEFNSDFREVFTLSYYIASKNQYTDVWLHSFHETLGEQSPDVLFYSNFVVYKLPLHNATVDEDLPDSKTLEWCTSTKKVLQ